MKKNILLKIFILIISSKETLAYVDPGTGGVIIGSIWPLISALFLAIGAFIVKKFWNPIKRIFKRNKDKNQITGKNL